MEGTREKSCTAKRKDVRIRKLNNPFLSSLHPRNDSNKKKRKKKHDQDPRMLLAKRPMGSDSLNKRKKKKKGVDRMAGTKFGEFLEMERASDGFNAEEDMTTMGKLGKKLKVKDGLLDGEDDGFNLLLEGLPSEVDFPFADPAVDAYDDDDEGYDDGDGARTRKPEAVLPSKQGKKCKREKQKLILASERGPDKEKTTKIDTGVSDHYPALGKEEPRAEAPALDITMKYVAPRLRAPLGGESEEVSQVRRRVRGLLNRLSESNVESITGEVANITRSIGRSAACQIIGLEVVASCSRGPRGNEQYAAIFAAFVAGMACLVGIDFSAKLLAFVAESFADEYSREDNLSVRNLTLLLAYLCIFGVCSSDLIYDLLAALSKHLTELDVSTILTLLQCCGMNLRSDDPTAMKNFVLSIQSRVNALRTVDDAQDGQSRIKSKRMKFMLETICDIKNNKRRPKEDSAHHTRIKKWLQKLRAEDVTLRGLKWSKLLDPEKKGQWWLSGEIASASDDIEEVATTISKEVMEAQKLVELASAQRMNTDIRRALFCIIMSAEDYMDAFEKILRLDLSGKQDREVMRVLVDCCLQEKVFNKYYTVLASKLCSHDKNHKFSLQYCLWDHFKEIEAMDLHRSMNLARFIAEMISSFTLSLSLLKTVDLTDLKQLTPRRIMHFRMLLESILVNSDALVFNIFTRLATIPELELLRDGIKYFIKQYVVTEESFAHKWKIVNKALDNAAGVLL